MRKTILTIVGMLICLAVGAAAQTTDPATLHINDGSCYIYSATSCSGGSNKGELHAVTGNSVLITQQSNGAPALTDPILVILGIAVTAANPNPVAPTLTVGNSYGGYTVSSGGLATGANATWWGTNFGTGGLNQTYTSPAGTLTSSDTGTAAAYQNAHIQNVSGDLGQSWTNWSGAYNSVLNTTQTPSQFNLFVYYVNLTPDLTGGTTPGDTFQAQFSSLAQGTFIIGFGCAGTSQADPTKVCNTPENSVYNSNPYDTPFTEAGFVTSSPPQVPEPASLVLFGSGLMILGGAVRRRIKA